MSTATSASRNDSGSAEICAKTSRALTAASGREPTLWSTGSNWSGIAVVAGRRVCARCRLTNVLRRTRSR